MRIDHPCSMQVRSLQLTVYFMDKNKKAKLEKAGWVFGDYATFLGLSEKEKIAIEASIHALKHHVDQTNIGQHDPDNTFMWKMNPVEQFDYWRLQNPNSVPIGFCDEEFQMRHGEKYIAFIFEDENGNRYHVHVPEKWKGIKL